ncbi:MAG: ARMT1-like domain-containing protein, partial [Sulfuricurvum sp.]|nr:ARMT1-like domain-containing protein [Sulfuricurvum sp.]
MTIQNECLGCITAQSKRVCEAIHADAALTERIVQYVETSLQNADFTLSPPVIAAPLYEQMAVLAGTNDLYEHQKQHATQQANSYIPFLQETIEQSDHPFTATLKTAVVGNVIDLAAEVSFDLHEAINSVFTTPFAHDDSAQLSDTLKRSKTVLYIGDNAGEHIFDALTIQSLQKLYPNIEFTYMVRGNPIINDVTMQEALDAKIDSVCTLMDSGVPTPGFVYELASPKAQELFEIGR